MYSAGGLPYAGGDTERRMVAAAKQREEAVLYSMKFPVGTDVQIKNRKDGVVVVVRGRQTEKPIRK